MGNVFFTQGQLRETVGLSKEAFRHWKRVVPAFANGRGHAPSFSSGDVLASAILRRLTETVGVRIGHLSEVVSSIFQACNASSWDNLKGKSLIIDLGKGTCKVASKPIHLVGELVVICALAPIIEGLESDLLNSQPADPSQARVLRNGGKR